MRRSLIYFLSTWKAFLSAIDFRLQFHSKSDFVSALSASGLVWVDY
jgi:hypothetical protein